MDGIKAPSPLRPVSPRARAAVACFLVTILLLVASTWHDFALLDLAKRAAIGRATEAEGAALDRAEVWIALGQVLALLGTAVAFCMWLHRTYANLVSAGVSGLKYTARRSVEAFFIPFVNLVRPYRVVDEVWLASRGLAAGSALLTSDRDRESDWAVGVWWVSMLLGNGYARYTSVLLDTAKTPADFERYAGQSIVADGVTLIAAAAAILLVRSISGWQEGARAADSRQLPAP